MQMVQGPLGLVLADHPARVDGCASGWGREARRAFEAMMTMKKVDVAAIEAARRG